jgi:hypothetical protein
MKIMKKFYLAFAMICALLSGGLFTSCDDGDGPYPSGTYYDPMLIGTWQLISANGSEVTINDTNYLRFLGNGVGRYYYQYQGQEFIEKMTYWCFDNNGTTNSMTIAYGKNSPTTVNYYFTDAGTLLWMQWPTGNGNVTYCYKTTDNISW